MKKIIALCFLLSAATTAFANPGCGFLGMKVINASNEDCVLRNVTLNNAGYYYGGSPPTFLAKGAEGTLFYLMQYGRGVSVTLDYRCGNKVVSFFTHQGQCTLFKAGNITAYPDISNDLSTEFQAAQGSWWASRPGQIIWRIY